MNKSILIRGSIIMGLFLLVIGAAVGCSFIKGESTEPTINNGNDVFLTIDDFTVTNNELYEIMKNVDGLNYLMEYVDRIMLQDTIDTITQAEIDAEIRLLIYKTDSDDIIAEIQSDPEIDQILIDAFNQNLTILGFDHTDPDSLREYVEVSIAKSKIAEQHISDATGNNIYALTDVEIKTYYDTITYGDVCALEVRFESDTEAKLVFDHFNLVQNFEEGIGEYFGTLPIEDVPSDGFILDTEQDGNTYLLDDEEVFAKYILLYNYMNPNVTPLLANLTQEDYCRDHSDIGSYNHDSMIKDRESDEPYVILTNYLFDTLTLDPDDGIRYSYTAQSVGDASVFVYKVSEEDVVDYEDLTDSEVIDLKTELIESFMTPSVIQDIVSSTFEHLDLEIFDPYLALKHEFDSGVVYDNEGSDTIVATIGDVEITADEFFTFMKDRVGVFYSIELAKSNMLLTSQAYTDMYGDTHDYMDSNLAIMEANREELRSMKAAFGSNAYYDYGLSSSKFTWEEFMYLAFNVKTESEVIENIFILQDLKNHVIFPTLNYDSVIDYMETQAAEYLSLNATHLLIYVDHDKDFIPDDFDEFIDELAAPELAEYEALRLAIDDLVFLKLEDGLSFEEIVNEYEDSLMMDPLNEWAQFKQFGFLIMTQLLTPEASLDHHNIDIYDDRFQDTLKRVYDEFVVLKDNSIEPITEYLDSQITVTDFGIHFILATEGSDFSQNTAQYDPTDDTSVTYSDGSANTSEIPNAAQIAIYNEIKFATIGGDFTTAILPPNVYSAIDSYYGETFDAYFSQTGLSVVILEYMFDNNPVYATNNAENLETLQDILDVLYDVNFKDGFVIVD